MEPSLKNYPQIFLVILDFASVLWYTACQKGVAYYAKKGTVFLLMMLFGFFVI